jgi:cell wall-associated NlpC family hydrolase
MNRIHAALTTAFAAVALCGTMFTGAATADPPPPDPTQELPQEHWPLGDNAKMPNCGVLASGASAEAENAVNQACSLMGTPYSWGGGHAATPGLTFGRCDASNGAPNDCHVRGLDCSGFTRYAYWLATQRDFGAGATYMRWNSDPRVARFLRSDGLGPLLPGDLLYFGGTAASIHHTALYLGNGYLVEAPYSGAHVSVNTVSAHSDYYGALRVYQGGTGASAAGPMFHQIRGADGQSWTGFQPLAGYNTTQPGDAKDMAIAGMPDGSAQVLVVGSDNRVYHEIRSADGQSWTGLQPLPGYGTPDPANAKRVAIAALPDGSAQVLIVGWDNVVYHEVRDVDGSWTGFQPLSGYNTPSPAGAKDVAIAGMPDGSAQVMIVGMDDRVYHEIRSADGESWTGLQPLPGYGTPDPAGGKRVAIAGLPDGSAQVLIIGADNRVYHEIRDADGQSWTGFQPLSGYQTPDPAGGKDVAIAGLPDGSAQVLIIGADNKVYHEIRNADGQSWTGFQPLPGYGTPNPAGGTSVGITGMTDGSAQVVVVGQHV